jgi:hypothetical protein
MSTSRGSFSVIGDWNPVGFDGWRAASRPSPGCFARFDRPDERVTVLPVHDWTERVVEMSIAYNRCSGLPRGEASDYAHTTKGGEGDSPS